MPLAEEIAAAHANFAPFTEIHEALKSEFNPAGHLENFFVHQMADAQWRLQRLARTESAFLSGRVAFGCCPEDDRMARSLGYSVADFRELKVLACFSTKEAALQRAYFRALEYLRARQSRRARA